jgi:hypothetical protein
MISELNFTINSLFKGVNYDIDANSWNFIFADKIGVGVSGFWRLLEKNQIVLVSLDHGHQFGLTKPLDLSEEIKKRLSGKKLIKIHVDKDTADLTLTLTDQFKLEVYIASSSYETYDFSIDDKRYIGLGSGDIAIMDIIR